MQGRPPHLAQGPTVLAVDSGEGCLDIFFSPIALLFLVPLSRRRPDTD